MKKEVLILAVSAIFLCGSGCHMRGKSAKPAGDKAATEINLENDAIISHVDNATVDGALVTIALPVTEKLRSILDSLKNDNKSSAATLALPLTVSNLPPLTDSAIKFKIFLDHANPKPSTAADDPRFVIDLGLDHDPIKSWRIDLLRPLMRYLEHGGKAEGVLKIQALAVREGKPFALGSDFKGLKTHLEVVE